MSKSPSMIIEGVILDRNNQNSSMKGTSEGEGGLCKTYESNES